MKNKKVETRNRLSQKWHYLRDVVGWEKGWLVGFIVSFCVVVGILFVAAILHYQDDKLTMHQMLGYILKGTAVTMAFVAAILSTGKRWVIRMLIIAIECYMFSMLIDLLNLVSTP